MNKSFQFKLFQPNFPISNGDSLETQLGESCEIFSGKQFDNDVSYFNPSLIYKTYLYQLQTYIYKNTKHSNFNRFPHVDQTWT